MKTAARRMWQVFELARVTIEFETAFLIGANDDDGLFDVVFSKDANGLPAIPGESLTGVLRHALADSPAARMHAKGEDDASPETNALCREVFGVASSGSDGEEGETSRVDISWGQVHGQDDKPVPFLCSDESLIANDPVLQYLMQGVGRDHVRIGGHGSFDDGGKFDELVVPAGARFTFDVRVEGALLEENQIAGVKRSVFDAESLIALMSRGDVRLGRGTRRGLGRFKVVRWESRRFDLSQPADRNKLAELGPVDGYVHGKLNRPSEISRPELMSDRWEQLRLQLEPVDTWYIGGSMRRRVPSQPQESASGRVEVPDKFPLTEARITWAGGKGEVCTGMKEEFLVPGSAVRGALRHRTLFHLHRLLGPTNPAEHFLPDNSADLEKRPLSQVGDSVIPVPACFKELWGREKPKKSEREERMEALLGDGAAKDCPSKVAISDTWFAPALPHGSEVMLQRHVKLDRFTQGPIDGNLFLEEVLSAGTLNLDIWVKRDKEGGQKENPARQALEHAITDLISGRLGIGVGRGHGRFKGKVLAGRSTAGAEVSR